MQTFILGLILSAVALFASETQDNFTSWKISPATSLRVAEDAADEDSRPVVKHPPSVRMMGAPRPEQNRSAAALASFDWQPSARWHIAGDLHLSAAADSRGPGEVEAPLLDEKDECHGGVNASGNLRASFDAWQHGGNTMELFGGYRQTFRQATEEESVVKPRMVRSYEGGVRARLWSGRTAVEATVFQMASRSLAMAASEGSPLLAYAGTHRAAGVEAAISLYATSYVTARISYSAGPSHKASVEIACARPGEFLRRLHRGIVGR